METEITVYIVVLLNVLVQESESKCFILTLKVPIITALEGITISLIFKNINK